MFVPLQRSSSAASLSSERVSVCLQAAESETVCPGEVTDSQLRYCYHQFISLRDICVLDWQYEMWLSKFQTGCLSQLVIVLLRWDWVSLMEPPGYLLIKCISSSILIYFSSLQCWFVSLAIYDCHHFQLFLLYLHIFCCIHLLSFICFHALSLPEYYYVSVGIENHQKLWNIHLSSIISAVRMQIRRLIKIVNAYIGLRGGVYMHGCTVSMAALLHIKPLMSSLLRAKRIQHCT